MTSIISNIFEKVTQVYNDPFAIREVNNNDYQRKNVVTSSDYIALHKVNNYYDVILLNPKRVSHVFRLCHLPLPKKNEANTFYGSAVSTLSILCKSTDKCYNFSTLQTICTTLRTRNAWSPVHVAVEAGLGGVYTNSGILQEWLDSQWCENHYTPLHLACKLKSNTIVAELLDAGALLSKVDDNGNTALHLAVKEGTNDILSLLCKHANEDVLNILNADGESALHVACKQNRFEECKTLLLSGADPLIPGSIGFPLHYALKYGSIKTAEILLDKHPGQVHMSCVKHGALPLHWSKTPEDINLLLKYDSPIDVASDQSHLPLHVMVLRNRLEAAVALILGNADVNSRGKNGNTALHLAITHDCIMLVKLLLLFGADHSLKNDFGETAGLLAVRSNKPNKENIVEMLSCLGALNIGSPIKPAQATTSHNISKNKCTSTGCKVLCLDGGGVRGLILTQILMAIEQQTGKKTRELFDWIAGTSTGGILAIALSQGRSAVEAQRLYFRFKDKVFSGGRPYNNKIIEEFLKQEFGEDATLESISHGPKVIVTATLADRKPVKLQLFRSYQANIYKDKSPILSKKLSKSDLQKLKHPHSTNKSEFLWKVARCSGAAPTYFSPMDKYLDGGLLANNPTLDALTEIHRFSKTNGENMNIKLCVSLGTGQLATTLAKSVDVTWPTNPVALVNSALAGIELTQMMVDVACESNSHVVDRASAWCESIGAHYIRLNPTLEEDISLDERNDTKLIDIMWQTQLYLHENKHIIEEMASYFL